MTGKIEIKSLELVETALRVLVAWNEGCAPALIDLEILKHAFPSSAHLPVDELACQVIHDLSGRAFQSSSETDDSPRRVSEVA